MQIQPRIRLSKRELARFQTQYPPRHVKVSGHTWSYRVIGDGMESLLLLHGGGGGAEAMFPQILGLASRYRVIAPTLPQSLSTIDDTLKGVATILNTEDAGKVHLYGVSFGGFIAQAFLRRYHARVTDVVLSHTAIPTEQHAERSRLQLRMMRFMPAPMLLWSMKKTYLHSIQATSIPLTDADKLFWQDYFDDLYTHHLSKQHLLSRARLSHDYFSQYTFNSSDLNHWEGRMLILQSDEDEVYSEGERGAVLGTYPRAWIHTFETYSHLATVLAVEETIDILIDFLRGNTS